MLVEADDVSARIAEPGGDFGRVRAKTRYTAVRKEPSEATKPVSVPVRAGSALPYVFVFESGVTEADFLLMVITAGTLCLAL